MEKNYYEVLGVSTDASFADLAKRFKVLAMTYHPELNPENMAQANFKFTEACEAFEVLSTPELRQIYDRYGEKILKNGVPAAGSKGGYKFNGDPFEIFENFFGTNNPYTIALDNEGKQIPLCERVQSDIHKDAIKDLKECNSADLEVECECSLEEFFFGSTKKVSFKKTMGSDQVAASKEIEIKPGMGEWSHLRFCGEGNHCAGNLVGDLVIRFKQLNHSFVREKNNLVYKHKVSLQEALNAAPIQFKTIDNENVHLGVDEVIQPNTVKVLKGKGMPIYNDDPLAPVMMNHARGDMIVKFDIQFPKRVTPSMHKLADLLDEVEAEE